jgi:hypothetical protein
VSSRLAVAIHDKHCLTWCLIRLFLLNLERNNEAETEPSVSAIRLVNLELARLGRLSVGWRRSGLERYFGAFGLLWRPSRH